MLSLSGARLSELEAEAIMRCLVTLDREYRCAMRYVESVKFDTRSAASEFERYLEAVNDPSHPLKRLRKEVLEALSKPAPKL